MKSPLILALAITLSALIPELASAASCGKSNVTAPIQEMNINNMFPITIAGQEISASGDAKSCGAMASAGSECTCPGRIYGEPTEGIMLTMYVPAYVAEVQGQPGCSPLLQGKNLTGDEYSGRAAVGEDSGSNESNGEVYSAVRQVHWYEYPIFSLIDSLKDSLCVSSGTVLDIGYMTEFDSLWQNDIWAAVVAPEGEIFANWIAAASCIIDTISSTFSRCPVDAQVWCGGKSHTYPWASTNFDQADHSEGGSKVLQKFMMRQTRFGLLQKTVGYDAQCSPTYSPVMVKSQFRLDLIYPNSPPNGKPVVMGTDNHFWGSQAAVPFNEGVMFLIWQGMQCCIHI